MFFYKILVYLNLKIKKLKKFFFIYKYLIIDIENITFIYKIIL